jgi:hypothetical protein
MAERDAGRAVRIGRRRPRRNTTRYRGEIIGGYGPVHETTNAARVHGERGCVNEPPERSNPRVKTL